MSDALDRQLASLPSTASTRVGYEELIAEPSATIKRLASFLGTRVVEPQALAALELQRSGRAVDPGDHDLTL